MKRKVGLLFLFLFTFIAFNAHSQLVESTTTDQREQTVEQYQQMRQNSIFKEYPVRNVGPVVMSGRVTDIAVHEQRPSHFYVAYASGGVFETTNSGNTMSPIFDNQGSLTIGDIAISAANDDILWVGTGENNSSRSSYAGAGIYKSTDGGKNWNYAGLRGSQHIGRIVTHPDNEDVAWVASMGPLYSMNDVRGIYKTTDGGTNWQKSLTPPDSTGVIDLIIHPENPDILWATTWQRFRQAWNFQEAGEGSAIYKSTDGGESWNKVMNGFPEGNFVGRIGIDVSHSNPDILYTFLDNQKETKTKVEEEQEGLTQTDFLEMDKKDFQQLDDEELEKFLRDNGFPEKYTAARVKLDVQEGKYEPKALSEYLGDANAALFETDINGAEVYKSTDGGESWQMVNEYALDNIIFTYGYYFGEVRVSPTDPDELYIMGVPALKSTDGGATWKTIAENQPVHVDHHAMWIDPSDTDHILLGNDGGLYESHDGGINFIHHNVTPVGQFYTVDVDMEKPYNIYGGLQDNGVYTGPSTGSPDDNNYWERLFGGDGMHVQVDPRNSDLVYTGFQFGNYFKIDRSANDYTRITPRHEVGEERYRYNWNTPVELSNHNADIVYFGTQKLNRSFDQGETWTPISPDLTNEKADQQEGDVPYSTLTTIAESPLNFNVIWVGTDDGNVQLTRDGGNSWTNVSGNLPDHRWVSEVHASKHDQATAYVSLNGYRFDEFKTYVYKTTDYGKTWQSVKGDLPEDVANIIIQDPEVSDILYAGLDNGTFVSFNDGKNWHLLSGIPNVASYTMLVHPRDLELVVATHGRSIYVSDVKPLHKVAENIEEPILGLEAAPVSFSNRWGSRSAPYRDINEPEVTWLYWIGNEDVQDNEVTITVRDSENNVVKELSDTGSYGFNSFSWNLRTQDAAEGADNESDLKYLGKGSYTISFEVNGNSHEIPFEVK
ncbi:glycosyl hydrolase [Balneolaceae bacterium YR4-1]|uniref:Glycosyl hydrolase n=1 Tax=Halalkalibaculum roseum TaxID=2709311 RepID=A0A6M1SW46_9BACT|nr:glycosyl hydrolase [Halalkalibaculum roseum]NGP76326.1 glycosyl hydrolase [Halalkalibaculum roseum]